MNLCCHDDYTNAGVFSADHKNIYIAWQSWLGTFESQSEFTNLTDFQAYFDTLVSQGQVNALINPIAILPTHPSTGEDCAEFNEQNSIAADDKNIFIAFQSWLGTFDQGESLGTLSEFQTYFDTLVSQGQVNALVNPVKHLPSLETDTQVITTGGLVNKCDASTSCTCSAVVETGVLKVDLDATTLSGTTDGNVKGVEIVFDNIVFGDSSHLSATPLTEVNKFQDTSNASTLNFYYDYAIRTNSVSDTPTAPTNTKSVIGFIDTTENGVGTTASLLNTVTFNVAAEGFTLTGDSPTIADVRVYDSSASVVQYDITRCE